MKNLVKMLMKEKELNKDRVEYLKKKWAKKNKKDLPLNSKILAACNKTQRSKLRKVLVTKPTRTLSGVSVIAIMAKPAACPGRCIYCPQGVNAPKSYTGFEPAAMRARLNDFDSQKQVENRLHQLNSVGHYTDKNELIIMGGTFPSMPWAYQKKFVKNAFDGFNGKKSLTLAAAQKKNEKSDNRIVGMTIETRPDYIYVNKLLKLGATRVEVGVQSINDAVLQKINRGNSVEEVIIATKILKNAGYKVLYHMMPGLPGSTLEKDIAMFKKLFSDKRFRPDMLKIYPTLVIEGTQLYQDWKNKKYKPINEKYMEKLLKEVYKVAPKYVRIMRVQRDIPAQYIIAGPTKSNLRELVEKKLKKSNEIRFREAGQVYQRTKKKPKDVEITVEKYEASEGTEYFIAAEDKKQDILVGFARLRILPKKKKAFLRELHVYDSVIPIGDEGTTGQHSGWGKKLMEKAEELTKENKKKELKVISGIGVRPYYKSIGYKLKGPYMCKRIK